MNRKQNLEHKHSRRKEILILVIALIAMIIVIYGIMTLNTSKVTPRHDTVQATHNNVSHHNGGGISTDILASFTTPATEDADTRTNDDTTYSQFYKQGKVWYWKLSSNKRGTIEVGKVSNIHKKYKVYLLSMTSERYEPGTEYELNLHWLTKNKQYNLHTDFKSINGNYTFGTESTPENVNTRNLSRSQIRDWIMRNFAKYNSADNENSTSDWQWYYWDFGVNKNNCVTVFVTENHAYANKHGATADPHVAPTVGSFEITREGYLKAYNIGTSGTEMVHKITGGNDDASSAIVAQSFDE